MEGAWLTSSKPRPAADNVRELLVRQAFPRQERLQWLNTFTSLTRGQQGSCTFIPSPAMLIPNPISNPKCLAQLPNPAVT